MLLKLYTDNPSEKELNKIAQHLKKGELIIFPTDSVYAIGCDLMNHKAIEKMAKLKGLKVEESNFSVICYDLKHIADYTKPFENNIFKLMKKALPGPFTFILNANNAVPKIFKSKKRTIGIRVPDNNIARKIVNSLGNPLASTSVLDDDEVIEYTTDPELIEERYGKKINLIIDGGFGNNEASTVVDCTEGDVNIIRQGIGIIEGY